MIQKLEIMSLNVNGLGNAIKRARVMTKKRKKISTLSFYRKPICHHNSTRNVTNLDMRKYATVLIVTKEL